MAELILAYDWAKTSIGEIHQWPQSLRTTLGTVLHSAFPMFLFWGDDLICFYNDAFRPSLGVDGKHPAIGRRGMEVWPEIWSFIGPLIDGVLKSGKAVWFEDQLVPFYRNGKVEEIYWTFSYSPAYGDKGEIIGVVVTCMETTKNVADRKKIIETEERGRLSVEAAELGTFDVNLITNEVIASDRFASIFGIPPSTHHHDYLQAIHPDDLSIRENAYSRAFENGTLEYEARVIWKDGSLHWVRVKGSVYYDDKNRKPVKLLGIVQDISTEKFFFERLEMEVKERTEELAQAHQSLLQGNKYLQRIINLFKEPLQVLQPVFENGNIIDFRYKITNDAYAAYATTTPEKLQGKRVGDVFPGYFSTSSFTNVVRTYLTGVAETWEIHYDVDGLDVYNEMSAAKMDDEVVVHFTDFTRLKNLELDLVHKVEELQRSNENLEEFAYAASHDLKEPIRKIQVFTGQLKSQLRDKLTEHDLQNFHKIEKASSRMANLIDDLLLYSHVSQLPHEMETIDLNEIVTRVSEDLELDIDEKGAVIHVTSLPTILGFRRQLQQLFQNLVSNALKYSKTGTPPEIHINSELMNSEGKQYHLISVRDNGIGFDPSYHEKIFHLFTRLHGNGEYSGSGVGLAIVKKIVENHQGTIHAESKPGDGSVFILQLPV